MAERSSNFFICFCAFKVDGPALLTNGKSILSTFGGKLRPLLPIIWMGDSRRDFEPSAGLIG